MELRFRQKPDDVPSDYRPRETPRLPQHDADWLDAQVRDEAARGVASPGAQARGRALMTEALKSSEDLLAGKHIAEVKGPLTVLTYGEMMTLADEFWLQVDPAVGVTRENLPQILWNFAKGVRPKHAQIDPEEEAPAAETGGRRGEAVQREPETAAAAQAQPPVQGSGEEAWRRVRGDDSVLAGQAGS